MTMNDHAASPLLAVAGVTVRFAGVVALDDVSFAVQRGELFAVIGPNGAGKTSLLNVLSRVYQPASGAVTFDGQDLLRLKTHQVAVAGIARTFQSQGQFPLTTVLDYLLLGRHTRMRGAILLGGVYLGPIASRRARESRILPAPAGSHGVVALARCPDGQLAVRRAETRRSRPRPGGAAKLLLLDEPVAGLGLEESQDLAAVLLDVKEQLGITQILVEHDMAMVMGIADRILVLDFGRVIARGAPTEIQANPEVIKAYLGQELQDATIARANASTESPR